MNEKIGLIGTITLDRITHESGSAWEGIGGVLYQAAVLCALGKEVFLYTNLGQDLSSGVERITANWTSLRKQGIHYVPGSGNQVHLHYPEQGERIEILTSVVPPLNPAQVLKDLPQLDMLILVINSGFDIELEDWQRIVRSATCSIWLDIHSLALSKELNAPRKYKSLPDWTAWGEGVTYIQANSKETASMLAHPEREPSVKEILELGERAFDLGTEAAFVTLGKEGVLVIALKGWKKISLHQVEEVVDTTGCGDVFCGGTAVGLTQGMDPFQAASSGLRLASKAVKARGVEETHISAKLS